jgi:hypothetical protein
LVAKYTDPSGLITEEAVMKKLSAWLLCVLMVAGMVATASAQDEGGGGAATTYDFEDDLVQGDLVRPDGENLMVRRRGARESLIKIREHFVPELLKSVENL